MVSTAQLHAAGLSGHAIRVRTRAGHLALAPLAYESAALLACGDAASLSFRSAAAFWSLVERDAEVVDVTVPRRRRHRPGIRVHCAVLGPGEVLVRAGLRVTTPLRALADVARVFGEAELERAVSEALFRRYVTEAQVQSIPRVRRLLDTGGAGSRHEAERRFHARSATSASTGSRPVSSGPSSASTSSCRHRARHEAADQARAGAAPDDARRGAARTNVTRGGRRGGTVTFVAGEATGVTRAARPARSVTLDRAPRPPRRRASRAGGRARRRR
jgi:hypothetical protein